MLQISSPAVINRVVKRLALINLSTTVFMLSMLRQHAVVHCVDLAPFTFSTTSGELQGLQLNVGARKVIQLLGVPYAKPPLDTLRYMKPVEYTSSTDNIAYDATYQRPMCIQFLKLADAGVPEFMRPRTGQSEDCLYMDIYIGYDRRLPPSGAKTRPAYAPPLSVRSASVSAPQRINFGGHQPLPPSDAQNSTRFVRPHDSASSSADPSFGNVIPRAIRDYFDGQRLTNLLSGRSALLSSSQQVDNVVQPHGGDTGSKLKPIMVFFHGGGFVFGSGTMYNASFLALGGDVIVVVPNYRLGPLGFMSFGNDELPGNAGLWDQHFVLQWVRTNALALGGDPNRVTIFGESSGAMSTSAHCLSPMSRIPDSLGSGTLFRRAVMQSGIITNNLVEHDPERIRAKAENFANAVQCSRSADVSLLACLQKVPVRQLRDAGRRGAYSFGIVVDGLFLPAAPEVMLREGRFHKEIDLLIGFNSDEGSVALANIRSDFELPDAKFEQAVRKTLRSTVLRPYAETSSSSREGVAAAVESVAADLVAYEYFGEHLDLVERISRDMRRHGQTLNSLGTILGDATDVVYSGAGFVQADDASRSAKQSIDEPARDRRNFGRTLLPSPGQQQLFNGTLTSLEAQTLRNLRRLMDITKDSLIEAPAVRYANMAANRGALVYMYVFSHEPTFEFFRKPPYLVRGAAHAEELPFLFGMVLRDFAATDAEQLLSVLMIDAWTNFAKFGNPAFSPDIAPNLPDWLPWRTNSAREHYFLDFDVDVKPSSLKQNVNSRKHYLWNDLLPRVMAAMSDCASGNVHPTIFMDNSPSTSPILLPTSATGGSRRSDGETRDPTFAESSIQPAVSFADQHLRARSDEQQIATFFRPTNKTKLTELTQNYSTSTTAPFSTTKTIQVNSTATLNTSSTTLPASLSPLPTSTTNTPIRPDESPSSAVITCVQNFTLPDPLRDAPSPLFPGSVFIGKYLTVAQADFLVCGLCALLVVTILAVIVGTLWCCCCSESKRSPNNKSGSRQQLLLIDDPNVRQQCGHLCNLASPSTMIAAFGVGSVGNNTSRGEPPPLPKIKRPFSIRTVPVAAAKDVSHQNQLSNVGRNEWCGEVSAVKKRYPWM